MNENKKTRPAPKRQWRAPRAKKLGFGLTGGKVTPSSPEFPSVGPGS